MLKYQHFAISDELMNLIIEFAWLPITKKRDNQTDISPSPITSLTPPKKSKLDLIKPLDLITITSQENSEKYVKLCSKI